MERRLLAAVQKAHNVPTADLLEYVRKTEEQQSKLQTILTENYNKIAWKLRIQTDDLLDAIEQIPSSEITEGRIKETVLPSQNSLHKWYNCCSRSRIAKELHEEYIQRKQRMIEPFKRAVE